MKGYYSHTTIFLLFCSIVAITSLIYILSANAEYVPSPTEGLTFDMNDIKDVSSVAPDIMTESIFYGKDNFMGTQLDGFKDSLIFMTNEAATALSAANELVKEKGFKIKVLNGYMPLMANEQIIKWINDPTALEMKDKFYPDIEDKKDLINEGYIKENDHTSGSSVDVTLYDTRTNTNADLGTCYCFFGEKSHSNYTGEDLTEEEKNNRKILKDAMTQSGFVSRDTEWWHFDLENDPYKNVSLNFPVSSESLVSE